MSPDRTSPARVIRWLAGAAVLIAFATAVALLLAQAMLAPPRTALVELGVALAVSGAISVVVGTVLVMMIERRFGLSLRGRFVAVTLVTCGILVANIVALACLMFISTGHDLQIVLATGAFGAIVAVAFATWAASMTTDRAIAINAGIRALAAGDRDVTVRVEGTDEFTSLARDLNALAVRLREADASRAALDAERRDLTIAISHDLRTPLATIRAMVDALDDGIVNEPAETRRYFATIRRDIERLNRMIDDLFELSQIDAGALKLRPQSIALDEVVGEVVDAMRAEAARSGVGLDLRIIGEPPRVTADGDRLERAVANLLRNALEHSPEGGAITVTLRSEGGDALLDVTDTGEGIDAEDLPHVWTRFYRAERSRTRSDASSNGAGLGLAITKGIVELHGGRVRVHSRLGAGATFELTLPAASAEGPLAAASKT